MAPKANKQKKPTLGIREKDYDESEIAPDDPRRNWVSLKGYSHRNRHPGIPANREDHGFNHLDIPTPGDVIIDYVDPPSFNNMDEEAEKQYLALAADKLKMVKNYILKEQELGLSPDRPNLHKEETFVSLGQGPIKFDIYTQQRIRLVMSGEAQILQLHTEKNGDIDTELAEVVSDYLSHWKDLQGRLAWQMPGKNEEEKNERAETIVEQVLPCCVESITE